MLRNFVRKKLHELGIPSDLDGYWYIKEIIIVMCEEGRKINCYEYFLKKYNLSKSISESKMRYAIEVGLKRANAEVLEEIFGYCICAERGKPTNTEFIYCLFEYVVDELELTFCL